MSSIVAVFACFLCVCVHLLTGELIVLKGDQVGYFDFDKCNSNSKQQWTLLFKKKKLTVAQSNENGIWLINKFNSVSLKQSLNEKAISMRKSFVSIATNHDRSVFGVNDKGQIYECPKRCENHKQWIKFVSPEMMEIENENVDQTIRKKLKMKPKIQGKLIHLSAMRNSLFGIDEIGILWDFDETTNKWKQHDTGNYLKWISVDIENSLLYVIQSSDNQAYLVSSENTKSSESIGDSNDLEQIEFDDKNKVIWALNYYKQLFCFDSTNQDWVLIDTDINQISKGKVPNEIIAQKREL